MSANDIFQEQQANSKTCIDCEHRQRHQRNSKVIQYCAVRKSSRTDNGLLKIKAYDPACPQYQGTCEN